MGETYVKPESSLERFFVNYAESKGCQAMKFYKRGWPDRVVFTGNGNCFFIEFKKKGEKPSKLQEWRHKELEGQGYAVYVCDNKQDAISALQNQIDDSPYRWFT